MRRTDPGGSRGGAGSVWPLRPVSRASRRRRGCSRGRGSAVDSPPAGSRSVRAARARASWLAGRSDDAEGARLDETGAGDRTPSVGVEPEAGRLRPLFLEELASFGEVVPKHRTQRNGNRSGNEARRARAEQLTPGSSEPRSRHRRRGGGTSARCRRPRRASRRWRPARRRPPSRASCSSTSSSSCASPPAPGA